MLLDASILVVIVGLMPLLTTILLYPSKMNLPGPGMLPIIFANTFLNALFIDHHYESIVIRWRPGGYRVGIIRPHLSAHIAVKKVHASSQTHPNHAGKHLFQPLVIHPL